MKPLKTHYIENGKFVCGTSNALFGVKTREAWYSSSNKCDKCLKQIKMRTLQFY